MDYILYIQDSFQPFIRYTKSLYTSNRRSANSQNVMPKRLIILMEHERGRRPQKSSRISGDGRNRLNKKKVGINQSSPECHEYNDMDRGFTEFYHHRLYLTQPVQTLTMLISTIAFPRAGNHAKAFIVSICTMQRSKRTFPSCL
ncbi:hypothetical protein QTP88_022928 [Uroleucon formosanum]